MPTLPTSAPPAAWSLATWLGMAFKGPCSQAWPSLNAEQLESQGASQFPRLWAEYGVPLFCNLGWVFQGFQQVRLMLQF